MREIRLLEFGIQPTDRSGFRAPLVVTLHEVHSSYDVRVESIRGCLTVSFQNTLVCEQERFMIPGLREIISAKDQG
jgi:hypothetical protein